MGLLDIFVSYHAVQEYGKGYDRSIWAEILAMPGVWYGHDVFRGRCCASGSRPLTITAANIGPLSDREGIRRSFGLRW